MNPYLLMLACSASFVLFLVLLSVALWKDLGDLRIYVRRHWFHTDRSRKQRTFSQMRRLESWSVDLEQVWLHFR